jgi:high affinity Mn2+ porin
MKFKFLVLLSLLISLPIMLLAQRGSNENHIDSASKWSYHFQLTTITQGHPSFQAKYSGLNSLHDSSEIAMSLTTTFFIGRKIGRKGAFYINPEKAGGNGISYALGLAGAANGETFRIGSPAPALYIARAFYQSHIAVGSCKYEKQEASANQVGMEIPCSRITFSLGKFSIADFFDKNKYSHDPRSQFMNWALMSNGGWDYPANTRGYTYGAVLEYITPAWSARIASVLVPRTANGPNMDFNVTKAHSETIEIEKKTYLNGHAGAIRFLAFRSLSKAPSYTAVTTQLLNGDSSLMRIIMGQKESQQYGGVKYGFGISMDQEVNDYLGLFGRVSWNDGQTATWAFTEIDHSASLGLVLNAKKIKRPDDNLGCAVVVNGISGDHRNLIANGGYGFIIGDGKLNNYGNEEILECYYKARVLDSLWLTGDFQFINNPAYNKDRGPVQVYAVRVHVEF